MVEYVVEQSFALLGINNPPVNALSLHVREGLCSGIEKANADERVKVIIITGKGKTFPSGADIREFGTPSAAQAPVLTQVGRTIENSKKPVISAIHGNALGGGLEIALFGHFRIADKNAKLGFPEVLIGIIPGAEGTVRLPRVAGLTFSMDLISSGKHITAQTALKNGILDKVEQ